MISLAQVTFFLILKQHTLNFNKDPYSKQNPRISPGASLAGFVLNLLPDSYYWQGNINPARDKINFILSFF
jgi:hypothetical protein